MTDKLYAGFAKVKVNPPMGINVPGYFRKRWSDGFITDLYLEAIARELTKIPFTSAAHTPTPHTELPAPAKTI